MNIVNFDTITKPTPAAYDAANPTAQQENFFYRLNQAFDQLTGEMDVDLADRIGDLSFEGAIFEIPGFIKVYRSGRSVTLTLSP